MIVTNHKKSFVNDMIVTNHKKCVCFSALQILSVAEFGSLFVVEFGSDR